MVLSSADAKREYFLTANDLRGVPQEGLSFGFGTGRPTMIFKEEDLEAAAIAKHGAAGLAKRRAARRKRERNKRNRAEASAAAVTPDSKLAAKKPKQTHNAEKVKERNLRVAGKPSWELTITSPERVAGTKAELVLAKDLLITGRPMESYIDCNDEESPAYSYGNIHGFKGKSSEDDAEMVFKTKWKVCGKRHTGKLSVTVQPSDRVGQMAKDATANPAEKENRKGEEESLMVIGTFDCGVNANGARRWGIPWSFKGYRKE